MMRWTVAASALVASAFLCLPALAAPDCAFENGEARWGIKTSMETGALHARATEIDLATLIATDNPILSKTEKAAIEDTLWSGTLSLPEGSRLAVLHEGDMVSVTGFLYRVRCQKDGDYHLEIGSEAVRGSPCLIVEVPDPEEVSDSELKADVARVRQAIEQLDRSIFTSHPHVDPVPVKVSGQLFLDATHITHVGSGGGNRGTAHCATNVWEIHPVTELN
jgi:hypothetical protein